MFRRRFWVSLVLTIPVLAFSPMLQEWLGFTIPPFPGSRWIGPAFALAIFFYGGTPFISLAVGAFLMSLSTIIVAVNAQLLRRASLG